MIYKGMFADTMPSALNGSQVALLMCDGDMYGSSMDCMQAGEPAIVNGGWLYNDDYYTFFGSFRAIQDYYDKVGWANIRGKIRLVPFWGDRELIDEDAARCHPPRTMSNVNFFFSGKCDGRFVQGA